jgi:hypothetical protein
LRSRAEAAWPLREFTEFALDAAERPKVEELRLRVLIREFDEMMLDSFEKGIGVPRKCLVYLSSEKGR